MRRGTLLRLSARLDKAQGDFDAWLAGLKPKSVRALARVMQEVMQDCHIEVEERTVARIAHHALESACRRLKSKRNGAGS